MIPLTTYLFFTITSPYAMEQVQEFLDTLQGQDNHLAFQHSAIIKEVFMSLNKFAMSR
jgi:DNA-binding transcriptional regulator WhiA